MDIKEKISLEYQRIENIVTEENPLIDGAIKDGILNENAYGHSKQKCCFILKSQ